MQMQIFYLYGEALSKERYCFCSLSSEISFSWTLSFLKLLIIWIKTDFFFSAKSCKYFALIFWVSQLLFETISISPGVILMIGWVRALSDFFWNFNDTDNAFILLLKQILSRSMKTSYYGYVKNSLIKILMTAVTHRQYKMIRHPVWKIHQRMEHMKVKPNRSSKVVDS